MRIGRTLALLCAVAGALCSLSSSTDAAAASQDETTEPVAVEASVRGGLGPRPAEIRIAADGAANVRLTNWDGTPQIAVDLTLSGDERADLRRRVAESRFFDEWGPARTITDQPTWTVTIAVGTRTLRRSIHAQDEFRPVEWFLWRLVRQAEAAADLREGNLGGLANALRSSEHQGVTDPAALVPDLCACIATTPTAWTASEGAGLLTELLPAEAWTPRVADLLARTSGERRDVLLVRWDSETRKPGRDAYRAAFAPIAFAEVSDGWREWRAAADPRRRCLRTLLGASLEADVPGALALVERMVRVLAPGGERFTPPALAHLREAAIPMTLRLLESDDADVRASAVWMARILIETAKPLRARADGVTDEQRAALATALAAETVAALERRANAADEVLETRKVAHAALRQWEGHDDAAERRAQQDADARERAAQRRETDAAEAARREAERAANAPPHGDLAISGRVVAFGDTPLPEMTVVARRPDGPPENALRIHGSARAGADGSFRIEGLVEGAFDLVALRGDRWSWREFVGNASAQSDVRAGTSDVVLRFPGGMLRGRVLDAGGRPLASAHVRVLLRDAPGTLPTGDLVHDAWAETDADGRFLVLQLLPGAYDVSLPGRPFLRGASGLEPGADLRTIEVVAGGRITGRVLDASGEAIPEARVGARPVGSSIDGVAGTVRDDGSFEIAGLDPAFRYIVAASVSDGPPYETRSAVADDVAVGGGDLRLRIDTAPEIAGRVEFPPGRSPRAATRPVRIERIAGGEPLTHEFRHATFRWRMAPPGTWRVLALVRDLDADGEGIDVWLEVGTVTTGDPAQTFVVPR